MGLVEGTRRTVTPREFSPREREEVVKRTTAAKSAIGPDHVLYDLPQDIGWAIGELLHDKAVHGVEIGSHLNDRAFVIAGRLKDGPRWGHAISEDTAIALITKYWSNEDRIEQAIANAYGSYGQNGPGVGPPNDPIRKLKSAVLDDEELDDEGDGEPLDFWGKLGGAA